MDQKEPADHQEKTDPVDELDAKDHLENLETSELMESRALMDHEAVVVVMVFQDLLVHPVHLVHQDCQEVSVPVVSTFFHRSVILKKDPLIKDTNTTVVKTEMIFKLNTRTTEIQSSLTF